MADLKRRLGPTEMRLVAMGNDFEDASVHMYRESAWECVCQVALDIGFGQRPLTKTMYIYGRHEIDALDKGIEQAIADLGERALDGKIITAHVVTYDLKNKTFSRKVEHLTYDMEWKSWIHRNDINDILMAVHRIHDRKDRKLTEEMHKTMEARQ